MRDRLDELLDELAERIAARVAERLRVGEPGMVNQQASPLGPRRHCAAVRRRINSRQDGAAVVGRQHLLSAEALAEELGRTSSARARKPEDAADKLRRDLGLLKQRPGSVREELMRELAAIKERPPKAKRTR